MKIFKFGGASVKDAAGIRNVASIIQKFGEKELLVVVSSKSETISRPQKASASSMPLVAT